MAPAYFYVGQRLNSFSGVDVTVEREASGGFGAVAMGPNRANGGRWNALKMLRPDVLADHSEEAQRRLRNLFLREALIWKGIWPHPNLLTAQFVTQINGQLMLVLDYAEQGSLRDIFQSARRRNSWLTFTSALDLAQQVAAGLVTLHTPDPSMLRNEPIVHRDLKPENVLINQHGFAMITDFGLAKAVAEALAPAAANAYSSSGGPQPSVGADGERLTLLDEAPAAEPVEGGRTQAYRTERGQALGTPAYMAPEQWVDAAAADCPADAYAFGIILAELLSNRHPLLNLEERHSLAEWRTAHMSGRPIPLRKLGADVFATQRAALPAGEATDRFETALMRVERLLARLVAKLPRARPSLREVLAELQGAAHDMGEEPYTPPETYPHTTDRERVIWQSWAISYDRFGLHAEALRRIERAYAVAPNHPAVLTSYGNILVSLGRVEEGLTMYRQSLAEAGDDDIRDKKVALHQLGIALRRLKRYAEADEAYASALALMPDDAVGWNNRAINLQYWAAADAENEHWDSARERLQYALTYAERAAQLSSDHPAFAELVTEVRQQLSRLSGARS